MMWPISLWIHITKTFIFILLVFFGPLIFFFILFGPLNCVDLRFFFMIEFYAYVWGPYIVRGIFRSSVNAWFAKIKLNFIDLKEP